MIKIGNKKIGDDYSVFTIAEVGSNHNRDKKIVKKLIDTISEAEFDSVKFQTYEPLEVFSKKITTCDVNYENLYGYRPWWEVARDFILMPREWFGEMFDYAKDRNLLVFSTVHSIKDAKFIMQFNPPVFKIASIDVTHLEFLMEMSKFKKPIILSTGMSNIEEIKTAVNVINKKDIILFHCVSCYPPKPEITNLKNILYLNKLFNLPIGFSDHSKNNYLSIASIALGACVIERHVTLNRNMKGPDHHFALTPNLMKEFITSIREVKKGLGSFHRKLSDDELISRKQIRRSIIARYKINKNEIITRDKIKLVRPGSGISPIHLNKIIGKKAKFDINEEDMINWNMVMLDEN